MSSLLIQSFDHDDKRHFFQSDSKMEQACVLLHRSYWVVAGKLLAGAYPGSFDVVTTRSNIRSLFVCGIRCIVSLIDPDESTYYSKRVVNYEEHLSHVAKELGIMASFIRKPIVDMDIPSRLTMVEILDELDLSISRGDPVFVHCWGGRGRTGTVVGCYLARHGLATGQEAIEMLKRLRGSDLALLPSPENAIQRQMVRSWRIGE